MDVYDFVIVGCILGIIGMFMVFMARNYDKVRIKNLTKYKKDAENARDEIKRKLATFSAGILDEKLAKFSPVIEKVKLEIAETLKKIEEYSEMVTQEIEARKKRDYNKSHDLFTKLETMPGSQVREIIERCLVQDIIFAGGELFDRSVRIEDFAEVQFMCKNVDTRMQDNRETITRLKKEFIVQNDAWGTRLCELIEQRIFPEFEASVQVGLINLVLNEEERCTSFRDGVLEYVSQKRNQNRYTPESLDALIDKNMFVEHPDSWAKEVMMLQNGFSISKPDSEE